MPAWRRCCPCCLDAKQVNQVCLKNNEETKVLIYIIKDIPTTALVEWWQQPTKRHTPWAWRWWDMPGVGSCVCVHGLCVAMVLT